MKLLEYIENNKDKIVLDNVFCYVENKKKPVIQFALYRHLQHKDNIYIYYNVLTTICLTGNSEHKAIYYKSMDIDPDKFIVIPRSKWSDFIKKSIKNSIDMKSETCQSLIKDINEYGGHLVRLKNKEETTAMLVGVSSTDEDYYYVLVSEEDNDIKLTFDSCCGRLDYIDEDNYKEKEYELINFIKDNKQNIINKINNLESDVMVTKIIMDKNKTNYRHYKNNALEVTFQHCNAFFDKPSKCIEVLQDILLKLNDQRINSYVIRLLNDYITEYGTYYKPLDNNLKTYYKEIFNEKLKNILLCYTNKINNDKVVSYLINVCKTLNKAFFSN